MTTVTPTQSRKTVDTTDINSGNNLSGVAVQFATQFWANATQ